MLPSEIIKKKRNNQALSAEEIDFFISAYTQGQIPDYQMAALLMTIYFNGMSTTETLALTKSMLLSGSIVDTSLVNGFKVDKHSTGGVGDKTSLILGPIVAATGLYVPMISGRGLGHTGGTLDKLESIPGFNTQQSLEKFISITQKVGACFAGQTKEICPADKKIYALRDVTATVESLPLICASIMSKKLAEGIDGLVLDVKFGSGAFMKELPKAKELARALMNIAQGYNKKIVSVISSMQQPLGKYAGNALEVFECIEILKNKKSISLRGYDLYEDTRELSLQLSAQMIHLSGKTESLTAAYEKAKNALESGAALKVFEQLCLEQGGVLNNLKLAEKKLDICITKDGFIKAFDVEKIGLTAVVLKAGRLRADDKINPTSGIEFHVKIGDAVKKGDLLYTLHGDDPHLFAEAERMLADSYEISLQKPATHVLITDVLE